MMLHRLGNFPSKIILAFSGGVDSVAILDFLQRGRKDITLAYFNHGTPHGSEAESFVRQVARDRKLPLFVGKVSEKMPSGVSKESWWREQRYSFLKSLGGPIITCHHLDDAVETWIFTSLHGKPRLIPYCNGQVIRPFLPTLKSDLVDWCVRHDLEWIEDGSNADVSYARNRIRHNIVPESLKVNPGLYKVIRKKVYSEYMSSK